MKVTPWQLALATLLVAACGGSQPAAESAADTAAQDEPASADSASAQPEPSEAESKPPGEDEAAASADAAQPGSSSAEPTFSDNMSVDEAVKAVPRDAERRNIDQETLGKPLSDLALYEPCKTGSAHVKMRVAVWDGKAVGIDISTKPKNEKLESCIKDRLREVTWEKKVKSLNTIEYQF